MLESQNYIAHKQSDGTTITIPLSDNVSLKEIYKLRSDLQLKYGTEPRPTLFNEVKNSIVFQIPGSRAGMIIALHSKALLDDLITFANEMENKDSKESERTSFYSNNLQRTP